MQRFHSTKISLWNKLYSTLFMHLKEAILAIKQKELV